MLRLVGIVVLRTPRKPSRVSGPGSLASRASPSKKPSRPSAGAKLSVKRNVVLKDFAGEIEALYEGPQPTGL